MIFGFNTDIKLDETVYHVQSEAREAEKLLQTQVFVKGYCIGKRATSYAADEERGQTEEMRHDVLRDQHRNVVQAIREGHLDTVIESASSKVAAAAAPSPASAKSAEPSPVPVASSSIELKFLGSSRPTHDTLLIRFGVAQASASVEGATITAQIMADSRVPETFSGSGPMEVKTDHEGLAELSLPIPPDAQGEASLVVQVHHAGLTAAKKFRIKTKA